MKAFIPVLTVAVKVSINHGCGGYEIAKELSATFLSVQCVPHEFCFYL